MFFSAFGTRLYGILIWGIGFIITGIVINSLIKALMEFVLSKKNDMIPDRLSIMGYVFYRDRSTGTYMRYMDKFTLMSNCYIIYDLSKPLGDDADEREKKVIWHSTWLSSLILILIAVPCLFLGFLFGKEGFAGVIASFFWGLGCGGVFQAVLGICISLYVLKRVQSDVMNEYNRCKKAIMRGVPFNMLSMRPIEAFEGKYSFAEEIVYDSLYCYYVLSVENFDEMKRVTERLRTILYDREPIMQYTLAYYWLVYYYSRYEINPVYANKFFGAVNGTIVADKDANAKRVQAYYYYAIRQDAQAARRFVNEGLAVIEEFSVYDEREIERKNLIWLDDFLKSRGI